MNENNTPLIDKYLSDFTFSEYHEVIINDMWIKYSTPGEDVAEYIAVCLPAFTPDTVHRDE